MNERKKERKKEGKWNSSVGMTIAAATSSTERHYEVTQYSVMEGSAVQYGVIRDSIL